MTVKVDRLLKSVGIDPRARELKHAGVKGMKWGSRGGRTAQGEEEVIDEETGDRSLRKIGGSGGIRQPAQSAPDQDLPAALALLNDKEQQFLRSAIDNGAKVIIHNGEFYVTPRGAISPSTS